MWCCWIFFICDDASFQMQRITMRSVGYLLGTIFASGMNLSQMGEPDEAAECLEVGEARQSMKTRDSDRGQGEGHRLLLLYRVRQCEAVARFKLAAFFYAGRGPHLCRGVRSRGTR